MFFFKSFHLPFYLSPLLDRILPVLLNSPYVLILVSVDYGPQLVLLPFDFLDSSLTPLNGLLELHALLLPLLALLLPQTRIRTQLSHLTIQSDELCCKNLIVLLGLRKV
jgi:hypothetical protein